MEPRFAADRHQEVAPGVVPVVGAVCVDIFGAVRVAWQFAHGLGELRAGAVEDMEQRAGRPAETAVVGAGRRFGEVGVEAGLAAEPVIVRPGQMQALGGHLIGRRKRGSGLTPHGGIGGDGLDLVAAVRVEDLAGLLALRGLHHRQLAVEPQAPVTVAGRGHVHRRGGPAVVHAAVPLPRGRDLEGRHDDPVALPVGERGVGHRGPVSVLDAGAQVRVGDAFEGLLVVADVGVVAGLGGDEQASAPGPVDDLLGAVVGGVDEVGLDDAVPDVARVAGRANPEAGHAFHAGADAGVEEVDDVGGHGGALVDDEHVDLGGGECRGLFHVLCVGKGQDRGAGEAELVLRAVPLPADGFGVVVARQVAEYGLVELRERLAEPEDLDAGEPDAGPDHQGQQ